MEEKEFILIRIFKCEIIMDLHLLKSRESKNYFLEVDLCVSVCVSVLVIATCIEELTKNFQQMEVYKNTFKKEILAYLTCNKHNGMNLYFV